MSDIIGVLGQGTVTTSGTATIYTVPASKAAKVRLQLRFQGDNDDTTDLSVAVNGIDVMARTNVTGDQRIISNSTLLGSTITQDPDGTSAALTLSPAPFEYFLSAGDTVTYTLGGSSATQMSLQAVGVEIDVT